LIALGLKAPAIEIADRLVRGYIRYSPVERGRRRMWNWYWQHVGQRTELQPKVAKTPFGFSVHVQPRDWLQMIIWLTGRWEPFITECFRRTLARGDTFIDVGSNIGYYSLLASRIVGRSGHVYSIEASPTSLAQLRHNIALNHADNVEVIQAIVADHDGEQEFWWSPAGCSTSVQSLASAKGMHSEGRIRCRALTSIVPGDQLLNARLIKIDVEGAERAVLEPLIKRLPEFSKRTVWAVEVMPECRPGGHVDVAWVFDSFFRNGYVAFTMRNDYSPATCLSRPKAVELERSTSVPTSLTDVLFLRE